MNADPLTACFGVRSSSVGRGGLRGRSSRRADSWPVVVLCAAVLPCPGHRLLAWRACPRAGRSGHVALDKGIVSVAPAPAGQLLAIRVVEGRRVREGQELAWLGSEENLANGRQAPVRSVNGVKAQNSALVEQVARIDSAAAADRID